MEFEALGYEEAVGVGVAELVSKPRSLPYCFLAPGMLLNPTEP